MREMQDSGLGWIGLIPKTWGIGRIGGLYRHRNTKVSDADYPPLSVTMSGVVLQLETAAKTDDHDNRKLVKVGDFAINSRSDRRGSCGISEFEGSVSLINTVLEPRGAMVPTFYNYLFHTKEFADEFYRWGHGIVDDLWTTRWQDMKAMKVPCPSIDEQNRISRYLDERCGAINAAKKSIMDELEALLRLRKAMICRAVTNGLDNDVVMTDSGVNWISTVPIGWKVVPLKTVRTFGKGVQYNKSDLVECGFPIVSYGQIHSKLNKGTALPNELIKFAKPEIASRNKRSIVSNGDILFAATSEDVESLGNCILIDDNIDILAGTDTIILRNNSTCSSKYLAYLFQTDCWRDQFRRDAIEIKVYHLSSARLRRTSIIYPPLREQDRIAKYLDERCAAIDAVFEARSQQLERLEDYRNALIYAYVTGKKEVPAS